MKHWIVERIKDMPNKTAIIQNGLHYSFQKLFYDACIYANFLREFNDNRIGLFVKNEYQHIALIIGGWLANKELVMLNTRLTNSEITTQLQEVQVSIVLSYEDININQRVYLIDEIYGKNQSKIFEEEPFDMNRIATIMFTSGTTGPSKAVPQTFTNHYYSALGCKESLGFDKKTKWLSVLPIYHVSGLSVLIRSLIEGFTIVIEPKFEVQRVMKIIKNDAITHISLVPQTLKRLMENGLQHPYQLKKILLGGSKLSEHLINEALNYNLPIYNSFGMTESCSQFVTASPEMLIEEPKTVGKLPSNVQMKIVHPNHQGHGEVAIKGSNVMNGYLNATNSHDEEGYFYTGDIGSVNEKGYVYIYDRRKDLIISGGENIYPFEIEQVAMKHTEISNCVAVPINDEEWGEVPVLVYESDSDIPISVFQAVFDEYLAKFKHPKYIYKMKEIPKTSTSKLSRHQVKEWVDNGRK